MSGFVTLWIGQSISTLGSAMTNFALIIWIYSQKGTATSIALLTFCSYLPSILFCFIAGTLADRWDKKKIMLLSDLVAAIGTATVFTLFLLDSLEIWHIYLVNFLSSFMNAFQSPASYVAVSLLALKEQYTKVGGMQAFSSSLITILTPALATAVLSFGGLTAIFLIDLASFSFAFLSLLFLIKIPKLPAEEKKELPFFKSCQKGLAFLFAHKPILRIILFFTFINLIAYAGGLGGILPAMLLSRNNGGEAALGFVSAAIGVGALIGSILVTFSKPPKSRTKTIFFACGISFLLCDPVWAFGRVPWLWALFGFLGNIPLPFLNANLSTVMRRKVPPEMQGRVFSARDTLQYCTIPLGLFLGGYLADNVFEPLMMGDSALKGFLCSLVGPGKGSGIAVMFILTGIIGIVASLIAYCNPIYKPLDSDSDSI